MAGDGPRPAQHAPRDALADDLGGLEPRRPRARPSRRPARAARRPGRSRPGGRSPARTSRWCSVASWSAIRDSRRSIRAISLRAVRRSAGGRRRLPAPPSPPAGRPAAGRRRSPVAPAAQVEVLRRRRRAGARSWPSPSRAICVSQTRSSRYRSCETTTSVPGQPSSRSSSAASVSVSRSLVGSSSSSTLGSPSSSRSSCSRRRSPPDRSLTGVHCCSPVKPSRSTSWPAVSSLPPTDDRALLALDHLDHAQVGQLGRAPRRPGSGPRPARSCRA